MTISQQSNALIQETSPYLLQHAYNPVQWYPWNEHSLDLAKQEGKPILLSIGYSACHWCHVMAHESFEDPAIAAVMNELFINIKVDREERPDLDKIYQSAHQLLARRPGGWPLTVFLTPENQVPFFAGTYFPNEPRHGMPSFTDLMLRIVGLYRERRDDVEKQNESLLRALASEYKLDSAGAVTLGSAPLDQARRQLADSFDARNAGFGRAPKFPHPTSLARLLHHHSASLVHGHPDDKALEMLTATLGRMASGGVYDQLGGGFYRYSVDDEWMIPHFEKMLYDNALLLELYAETWQRHPQALYEKIVRETGAWVIRDMQSPQGGYWSTLDADSEGREGIYYVWTPDQVKQLLEEDEYALLAACFGLDRKANFEGLWHFHGYADVDALAQRLGSGLDADPQALRATLDRARAKLLQAREQRVPPGRDEKVLCAWNGLMIKGMAVAGRVFDEPALVASARRALRFVRENLWKDGRLLATYKDGVARLDAYLDDHAFLMDAVLALLETHWSRDDLDFAVALAERLLEGFQDPQRGGFFFTANDHERLIHRPKPYGDDALPAGNAVAARSLLRLGQLLGEPRYLEAADSTLRSAWSLLNQAPMGHEAMLDVLAEQLEPPPLVVLRADDASVGEWRNGLSRARLACALYPIPPHSDDLPEALSVKTAQGDAVAYLCRGQSCSPPMQHIEQLLQALN